MYAPYVALAQVLPLYFNQMSYQDESVLYHLFLYLCLG